MSTTVTNLAQLEAAFASPPVDDLIIVDGTISVTGDISCPAGVTLRGISRGGAELQMGTSSNPGPVYSMTVAENCSLEDLIVSCPNAGSADPAGSPGTDSVNGEYSGWLVQLNGVNITCSDCIFKDRASINVRVENFSGIVFSHCMFQSGFYGVACNGMDFNQPQFINCHWEFCGEGFKATSGGPVSKQWSDSTKEPDFWNCSWYDCSRDGIDLTKGWRNLWIKGGDLWESIDFKTPWDSVGEQTSTDGGSVLSRVMWDARIEEVHIVKDDTVGIYTENQNTATNFLDGSTVTPGGSEYGAGAETGLPDWIYYGPRNIEFRNCIFEAEPAQTVAGRVMFMKAGWNISITNPEVRGGLESLSGFTWFENSIVFDGSDPAAPSALSATNFDATWTVTGQTTAAATSGLSRPTYDHLANPTMPSLTGFSFILSAV